MNEETIAHVGLTTKEPIMSYHELLVLHHFEDYITAHFLLSTDIHSSSVRLRYGMFFVSYKYDFRSTFVTAALHAMSFCI